MRIWFINHYAVPVRYHPIARTPNFAKYIQKMGHEVTIFAASSVHNNPSVNLVHGNKKYESIVDDGLRFVLVKCHSYRGNGIDRIINMFEFAWGLKKTCREFSEPDVVISYSATPIACMAGMKIARKYGAKTIADITDLWPESFVAYGMIDKRNPVLHLLYAYERHMYEYADRVIFSMEGAYDYIKERGWEKQIPPDKVFHINNGVDLEVFDKNKSDHILQDPDLTDDNTIKVIYVGSIRTVNNLDIVLDVAKRVGDEKVRFLIWGDGDQLERLRKRVNDERIGNVRLKGYVEKKYVPYIVSRADINLFHNGTSDVFKYGSSGNKLFDCLAAGKPIVMSFQCGDNLILRGNAGIVSKDGELSSILNAINEMLSIENADRERYGQNARRLAEQYDFKILAERLMSVINT